MTTRDSQALIDLNLGLSLSETLEHFAEEGYLVDIFLKHEAASEELQELLLSETQSVRIVLVGEDYVVLGPKRPLISCLVPIDSILMVRISDEKELMDEEEIDKEIEENYVGWERDWATSFSKTPISPDGSVHLLDFDTYDQSIEDDDLSVIFYADESKNSSKVAEKIERLAEEFKGQAIFVKTLDPKLADSLWMKKAPSVAIAFGDEVFSQIKGVAGIGEYRSEIREALEEIEEEEED